MKLMKGETGNRVQGAIRAKKMIGNFAPKASAVKFDKTDE
jgi:hypothetical protein